MPALRLIHLTDPHLFADDSRRLYGINTAASLHQVLAAALAGGPAPDAVIVTGDIGDDHSPGAYAVFRRTMASCGVPVWCLPGNHDDPQVMAAALAVAPFHYGGHARIGGWGIVLLDTHVPGEAAGRLSAGELLRLDATLHALADLPVLVCLHHPPVPVGSEWLDAVGLANPRDFLDAMDRHPHVRAVLAGHVHQEFEHQRGSVRYFTTPSTCAQFAPRTPRCVMDRRPPGYRRLELTEDGSLTTDVCWLSDLIGEPQEDEARRQEGP